MRDYNQIVSLETFTTVTCTNYIVEYFIFRIQRTEFIDLVKYVSMFAIVIYSNTFF
jgi:hypothetical protein